MKSSNAFNVNNLQTWEAHSAAAEMELDSQPSLTEMRGLPTFVVPPLLEGLANQVTSSSLPDEVTDWYIKCNVPWHWDMAWELGLRIWHCFGGKKSCMAITDYGSRHASCCINLYCVTSLRLYRHMCAVIESLWIGSSRTDFSNIIHDKLNDKVDRKQKLFKWEAMQVSFLRIFWSAARHEFVAMLSNSSMHWQSLRAYMKISLIYLWMSCAPCHCAIWSVMILV